MEAGGCPLSSRELQLVGQLAEGLTYKEIGLRAGLRPSTVRSYLHNAYVKTGVVDRAQVVLLASRLGWLDQGRPSEEGVHSIRDLLVEKSPPAGTLAGLAYASWLAGLLAGLQTRQSAAGRTERR